MSERNVFRERFPVNSIIRVNLFVTDELWWARTRACVCVDKEVLQIKLYIYATTYMRYVLFVFEFNTLTATPKLHFIHSICQDIR